MFFFLPNNFSLFGQTHKLEESRDFVSLENCSIFQAALHPENQYIPNTCPTNEYITIISLITPAAALFTESNKSAQPKSECFLKDTSLSQRKSSNFSLWNHWNAGLFATTGSKIYNTCQVHVPGNMKPISCLLQITAERIN